ncbi:MAG: hypothetical protein EOO59_21625, partial [Hymenobacter sp.]
APAGPHLPVALLRQYAAGTLAPAAQHRVEAHTLACSRCASVCSSKPPRPGWCAKRVATAGWCPSWPPPRPCCLA